MGVTWLRATGVTPYHMTAVAAKDHERARKAVWMRFALAEPLT